MVPFIGLPAVGLIASETQEDVMIIAGADTHPLVTNEDDELNVTPLYDRT